ncbi:coiled-coil domain-containing protein [Hyphomonas pacifica]|uniref:Bacteriophage tail tape measure C-terminal domain-containing protein n=1 Tax=Hyphomonas pacifica TaxID=1280941 RepID=A0A8B2PH25_9PROT|nr:hypothetical protein [Hyphomonas pacifica]RAN30630.1 hypothetical protein HY3_05630 [Hyphomonas pacifica]
MKRANEVSLRLSLKGREDLIRAMREMGGEHEKAAKKIEAGSKRATISIKAIDKAANETKRSLEGMAGKGGILGNVLGDLGPIGLAAGAGIGAIGVALAGSLKIAREAISAFDRIGKAADTLLLSTDAFQSLNSAAIDEGVNFERVEMAVRALDKRHSELVANQGELYTRLKDINPELVEMLRNTVDNDSRLRILTKALQEAETATKRSTIAYAAFGEGGADVARMLIRQEDGLDGMIERAKELGLVVDESLIRSSEEMENRFGQASKVIDLQLKQAFIDLAPTILQVAEFAADVSREFGYLISQTQAFSDRTTSSLERKTADLMVKLAELGASAEALQKSYLTGSKLDMEAMGFAGRSAAQALGYADKWNKSVTELAKRREEERQRETGDIRRRMTTQQLQEERKAYEDHLQQIDISLAEKRNAGEISLIEDPYAQGRIEVQRVLDQINAEIERRGSAVDPGKTKPDTKAIAEMNRLRADAIRLQKELGDYTAYLAQEEARYRKMEEAGLITSEQRRVAVKALEDELSGVTDAQEKWAKIIEDSLSPADALKQKIKDLEFDFADGKVSVEAYNAAMKALKEELLEVQKTELEAKPGFAAAETIRKDLVKAAEDAMTPFQKLQAEIRRVRDLVSEGVLDDADATQWLEVYEARLRKATEASAGLRAAEELLDGVQANRIRTLDDLGRTLSAMLVNMVRDYLAARKQMQGGSFLDYVFGTGQFGFGGPQGGSNSGLSSVLSVVGSFFGMGGGGGGAGAGMHAGATANIGFSHSGGSGRNPAGRRSIGHGLYPGERMMVVEDDETILTASGRMSIANQIASMAEERRQMAGLVNEISRGSKGGGGSMVKLQVNNYAGADVAVSETQGADGPEMSIDIHGKMKESMRSGTFDAEMKDRYGLRPVDG